MASDTTAVPSLYTLAIKVVLQKHFNGKIDSFDLRNLPDRVINDLLVECLSYGPKFNNVSCSGKSTCRYSVRMLRTFFNEITLSIWVRLLKYEAYRKTLILFYQALSLKHLKYFIVSYKTGVLKENKRLFNYDCYETVQGHETKINRVILKSFEDLTAEGDLLKHIDYGLILGSFFSETSWYEVSESILKYVKQLCNNLPENQTTTYITKLECCQRLFHTLSMFFKFDNAAVIMEEIEMLRVLLERDKRQINYALLFTEYSRYNFLKNNYKESHKWIHKAMNELHDKLPVPIIVDVLRQASRVCVVKRDFNKAEYLMHQALGRAYQHYGQDSYKLAALLLDFGFYLLNSDQIDHCVTVYREAYSLRKKMFDHSNNLLVAIAEEDLAYALYVNEYSSGYFDSAMKHAKQAISTMEKLLPPGNLMLSSANRVKALILEEIAIDNYTHQDALVNMDMLEEAERLHKDALRLTKRTFGEENILTAKHYGNLGRLYQSMRKYEEAEKMHLKAIRIKEKTLGEDDYEVGLSVGHLASLYNYHMQKYEQAEILYRRSININIKLFSEAYSGLEYDYRGLIHVYEHLSDPEQYLKYSNKLLKWNALRSLYVQISESLSSNFYENIKIEPLEVIVHKCQMNISSVHQNGESSQC